MAASPPEGMPQIIPYLYYEDAGPAVDFMVDVFGFSVEQAFRAPDSNRLLHATIRTGSGVLFVGPGMEPFGTIGMQDADWVPSMTYVFVDDVEAHYARVKASDAVLRSELDVHFGGNRQYTVSDPFGQRWTFAEPAVT